MEEKPWDLFMFVDMGVDRIHHGMWKYHDITHPKHEPGNRYQYAIRDYYIYLDQQIGSLLERVPEETLILTVSDHGVKGMHGGICVNEWLRREGYLALLEEPHGNGPIPFEKVKVDWSKTRVWGAGGYYARIFMNVEGREPQGTIPAAQYEQFRDTLAEAIRAIPAPDGSDIGTRVFKPQQVYQEIRNIAPDLIVYFGDLSWRSVGSFGHRDVYTFENDTGPDDANHAENGMFILTDPQMKDKGCRVAARQLMDVAPTILNAFGLPIPPDMQGTIIKG
jgi:predicted AlkP superfamily phosphohydrolase/phosphomutase